ncbi:hypothetical protein [Blastococcus sp. CT_GayMR16]|uniref:hypothetical protein n=1 Tax=Blastococcus sp. CT_GayMR16 TaxID=2559607 RepID=UPI0010747791|nr:hypothetical protein [Blastococcus sp. CT_GayMR16]TFV90397.1 hypothetical protein E4P38_02855 [Blastococcus sp. CT_GayMR16]
MAAVERVVKHAVFTYLDSDGVYRTALRGETISIDGDELARGERFDVFFDDDEAADVKPPLDGALVGDDEILDGEIGEVDLVAAVASLDDEQRAALADALAATAPSSPAGAQPTPLDRDAAAAGADELSSTGVVADSESEPERPPQTANKAIWLQFRGLGDLTEEQAEAITVKELKDDEFMASYQRPAGDPGGQPGAGA